MKIWPMRNLLLFVILFSGIALVLQGCGGGSTSTDEPDTTTQTQEETTQDTSADTEDTTDTTATTDTATEDTATETTDESTPTDTTSTPDSTAESPNISAGDVACNWGFRSPYELSTAPVPVVAATQGIRNPDKFVYATNGSVFDSLDPAYAYDSGSGMGIFNIYDFLVFYDGPYPDRFVPMLATDVPSIENGLMCDNSTTYIFPIKEGIKFHYGPVTDADGNVIPGSGEVRPDDVVYSFRRAMLQDAAGGPTWMYWESLFGYSSLLDMGRAIEAANGNVGAISEVAGLSAETKVDICNRVKNAIYEESGSAVFKLDQPFAPFMQIVGGYWGAVLDREFMMAAIDDPDAGIVKAADWDESCDTWEQFYDPLKEDSTIYDIANGTGPYKLERWRKEEEIVLVRNDEYWRERPAYIEQVVIERTTEWAARLLKLQQGDADYITVRTANRDQVQPLIDQGMVTLYDKLNTNTVYFWKLNQNLNMENNPYVGSGELDGEGIPADFFADVDVRKGFGYLIDYDTFVTDINGGDGSRAPGFMPQSISDFNTEQEYFTFDLEKAEEHFKLAFDGRLWEVGFKFISPHVPAASVVPNLSRLMSHHLAEINPKFQLVVQDFQSTQISEDDRQGKVPLDFSAWSEDYHDAHNWVFPILHERGFYANTMSMEPALQMRLNQIIEEARNEPDLERRKELYYELQKIHFDEALSLPLVEYEQKRYLRSWLKGFMHNPGYPNSFYFWQYRKEGATN